MSAIEPKPNCKHCHGRGIVRWLVAPGVQSKRGAATVTKARACQCITRQRRKQRLAAGPKEGTWFEERKRRAEA